MQPLLMCALLALATAMPKQVTENQWVTDEPKRKPREATVNAPLRPDGTVSRRSTKEEYGKQQDDDIDDFENRNPDFTDDGLELFESDMVLTAAQRDGRQAASNVWTSPVSYAISSTSVGDTAAIEAGIDHWREHTCIEFNKVNEGSSVPHINVKKSSGCWSYVGMTSLSSNGQDLSIGSGCTGLGTVVHEFGHAMGLSHQQARPDRDTYVTILFDNIRSGKEGNFAIRASSTNYTVPYDLTSVMHYGSRYFSSNGRDTIQVKDTRWSGLIGRRGGLSHRDKKIANALYNCAAGCSNPPTCQNGGYVSKACTCVCSDNTSGANCETLTGHYYGDGGAASCGAGR